MENLQGQKAYIKIKRSAQWHLVCYLFFKKFMKGDKMLEFKRWYVEPFIVSMVYQDCDQKYQDEIDQEYKQRREKTFVPTN